MIKYIFTIILFFTSISYSQTNEWLKEHYTKKEYRITMRDGVTLFTSVYSPQDTSVSYPILLMRTPYSIGPYGEDNFPEKLDLSLELIQQGYILAFQDVRGKFMSEGEYENMRPYIPDKKNKNDVDESTDAYDTIDWLIKNIRNNNGKVGMWGISYPGFYAAMGLIDAHPALKAVSPQAPISDWFIGDDMHHNGAFTLTCFNFFKIFDQPRDGLTTEWKDIYQYDSPDMYSFFLEIGPVSNLDKIFFHDKLPFWNDMEEHGTYDEFWQRRNIIPHLKNIKPAVLTVGGWYDSEDLYGPINIYRTIEKFNPINNSYLVLGPWYHGGWIRSDGSSFGDFTFPEKTSNYFNKNLLLPFFNYYLKDKGEFNIPDVITYRTGSNKWIEYTKFPSEEAGEKLLYLSPKGKLDWNLSSNSQITYNEFLSDPYKPVPYTAKFHDSKDFYYKYYMNEDQRFAAARPDVLVYETESLKNNITISGPIEADLFVSTTGTDADWIVKVIDVHPDSAENPEPNPNNIELGGYQQLLRYEIMRGKFRNSYEHPEPFEPNKITNVKIKLQDIDHTFHKGHKIMIQIQSSMFPFFDRNPQKFIDIYSAEEKDFQKAFHRVYFSKDYPSSIKVYMIK